MDVLRKLGIRIHTAKSLEKKHRRRIKRAQFNFACDPDLIDATRIFAEHLEIPVYLLMEHLIQTGAKVLAPCLNDPELKRELQFHLVKHHLHVTQLDPRREPDYSEEADGGDPEAIIDEYFKTLATNRPPEGDFEENAEEQEPEK